MERAAGRKEFHHLRFALLTLRSLAHPRLLIGQIAEENLTNTIPYRRIALFGHILRLGFLDVLSCRKIRGPCQVFRRQFP